MAVLVLAVIGAIGCIRHEPTPAARQERSEPATKGDAAARAVGRGAYRAAEESKEAAKKAGKALWRATKEAREGWKEARQEDRVKQR